MVAVRAVADAVARDDCPVTEKVPPETSDDVAVTMPPVRVAVVKVCALRFVAIKVLIVVVESVVIPLAVSEATAVEPVNVLSPANVCVVVDTTPREADPAFGMLIVCVAPPSTMAMSFPEVPMVKN